MTEIEIIACADAPLFAREKNRDVGNEDVTALTLLQSVDIQVGVPRISP